MADRKPRCTARVRYDKDRKAIGSCLRPEGHTSPCALDTEEYGVRRVSTVLSWAMAALRSSGTIDWQTAHYVKDMIDDALYTLEQMLEWQKGETSVVSDALNTGRHADAIRALVDVIGKETFVQIALDVAGDRLCQYETQANGTMCVKPPPSGWPKQTEQVAFVIETDTPLPFFVTSNTRGFSR